MWLRELLEEKLTNDFIQNHQVDIQDYVNIYLEKIIYGYQTGELLVYTNKYHKILFIVKPINQYVGMVGVLSKCKSGITLVRFTKEAVKKIFSNTDLRKLQMYAKDPRLGKLAEKAGWSYEGTSKKSYVTSDGDVIDQLIYGIAQED